MWLRIIIAAALLAIIGAAYYYLETSVPAKKEEVEKERVTLLDFKTDDVTAFTIKNPDGSSVSVNNSGTEWKITDPIKAPADQNAVEQVISTAAGLASKKEIGEILNSSEFGLNEPAMITFALSNSQTKILKIGGKTPNGSDNYIMTGEGKTAYTIEGRTADGLLKTLFDLRNKNMMPFDTLATVSFTIERGGALISAERVKEEKVKPEDARWTLIKPESSEADRGEVIKFLSRVTEVKAEAFVEEDSKDLKKYGLDKPEVRVTLVSDDNKKAELLIGSLAPEGGRYAKMGDSGVVIRISADTVSGVPDSAEKLKLKLFTGVDRPKITRISGQTAQWRYTADRTKPKTKDDDDQWKMIEPSGILADNLSFAALMFDIEKAKYAKVIAKPDKPSAYGLDKPFLKLTISFEGGAEKTITTGTLADKGVERYYAAVTGRNEVFEMEKSTFDSLARPLSELEDRRFFITGAGNVGKIVVKRLGQVFEIAREGDGFVMLSPEKKPVSPDKWNGFVWQIIGLKAIALRQGPEGATGLDKPSLSISVYNTAGVLLDEVVVGSRYDAKGVYYAKSSKKDGVCAVDGQFVTEEIVNSLEGLLGHDER